MRDSATSSPLSMPAQGMWTGLSWALLLTSFSATSSRQYAFHMWAAEQTAYSTGVCPCKCDHTNQWSHSKHEITHHFLSGKDIPRELSLIPLVHLETTTETLAGVFLAKHFVWTTSYTLWLQIISTDRKSHVPWKTAYLTTLLDKWLWQ